MKLEINIVTKTIFVEEETPILEVLDFLKGKELSEWKIKSKETIQFIDKWNPVPYTPSSPYLPSPNLPWYQPIWVYDPNSQPFYITCTTYETHTT